MTKQTKSLIYRSIIYILVIVLAVIYMILCERGLGIPCFYKQNFNIQCIGCGATRAFVSLCHFDMASAISYHPIYALFIYPVIGIVILQDYIICIINAYNKTNMQSLISYVWYCLSKKKNV